MRAGAKGFLLKDISLERLAAGIRSVAAGADNSMGTYQVAVVRFVDWPAQGTVLTRAQPLAIGTMSE